MESVEKKFKKSLCWCMDFTKGIFCLLVERCELVLLSR